MKVRFHAPLCIAALTVCSAAFAGPVALTHVKTIGNLSFGTNNNQISDLVVIGNDIYYVGRIASGSGNVSLGKVSNWLSASSGGFVADLGAGVLNRAGRLDTDGTYIYYGKNLGDLASMQIQRLDLNGVIVAGGPGGLADGILTQAEIGNNLLQGMAYAPSYAGGDPKIGGVQLASSGFKGASLVTGSNQNINPPSGPSGNRRDISFFANGNAVLDQDGAIRLLTRKDEDEFFAVPSSQIGSGVAGSFATVHAVDATGFFDAFVVFNASGNKVSVNGLDGTNLFLLDGTAGGNAVYANAILNYYYSGGYLFVSGWDNVLGSRIDVYATQAVPEPATLLGLGIGAALCLRRRRK